MAHLVIDTAKLDHFHTLSGCYKIHEKIAGVTKQTFQLQLFKYST